MPRLNVTILIQGRPARRLYVEHIWKEWFLSGPIDLYITDDSGRVRDEQGQLGINSRTNEADIRILSHNAVAQIHLPVSLGPIMTDKQIENGTTINLETADEHVDHYRILQMAMKNYEEVHRHFEPFSRLPNPDFPLGRKIGSLERTKDQKKRIEIVYPDDLPQLTPFVEPKSWATSCPLIHIKDKSQARDSRIFERLFGTNRSRADNIPAELAHALHFSLLDAASRKTIKTDYLKFLATDIIRDGDGTHRPEKRTTAMVAYLEALDCFSSRASAFVSHHNASPDGFDAALARAFIEAETKDNSEQEPYW